MVFVRPSVCLFVCPGRALLTYLMSQSTLLDPLDHPHWLMVTLLQPSVDSSLKITKRFSVMLHFTYRTLSFLLLFVFLISLVHHHHRALLRRHALILDRLLMFFMAFSTLVLKHLFLKVFPSIAIYPPLHAGILEFYHLYLAVTGGVTLTNAADQASSAGCPLRSI